MYIQISVNHIALLRLAQHGISVKKALTVDQRTLGSACTKTSTRKRTVDFDLKLNAFTLTDFGYWILNHGVPRRAKDQRHLSVGVDGMLHKHKGKVARIAA